MSLSKNWLYETNGEAEYDEVGFFDEVVVMRTTTGYFARCQTCPFDGNIFPERFAAECDAMIHQRASHHA